MSKFKIGDRVEVIENVSFRKTKGKHGVIITRSTKVREHYGVEFYEYIEDAHSCDGIGKTNNCLWVDEFQMVLSEKYKVIDYVLGEDK